MRAAAYARYSTEMQSPDVIPDQFRVCERLAERHGLTVVAKFFDEAISGGTAHRDGYQKLLAAARRHEFDVIVAEDASRLWRNLAEQAPRLAELSDLGIAVVTHDLDTRHESAEIMGAIGGAIAASYRKEIGRRTRRGLEGLARSGKSTGGRSYGYIGASKSASGQREIDSAEAEVVKQIFTWRAEGRSAAWIAAELNRRAVPSPGSTWARETRRKRSWLASAVAGDPTRGIGILCNELYRGVVIWNRTKWIRAATDSSQRRAVQNPKSEWIIRHEPRLQIISDELWKRVREVQEQRAHIVGERVRAGKSRQAAASTGPGPKYLFSTLLECGQCGANFVMVDARFYGCSSFKHGGGAACSNDFRVKRSLVEDNLLAGIRRELLDPQVIEEMRRRVAKHKAAASRRPDAASTERRAAQLKDEIANLTDAIAKGILRTSPAIAERLAATEAELTDLQKVVTAVPLAVKIERMLPRVVDSYTALVNDLPAAVKRDVARARAQIRQILGGGPIRVEVDAVSARFMTQKGRAEAAFLRAAGADFGPQTTLVAGAGFEPATFGL